MPNRRHTSGFSILVSTSRGDAYALVQTEVVSWRSVANTVDIAGTLFTRLTLLGRVEGPASWLPISRTAELLIVCEPIGGASDYQLLQGEVDEASMAWCPLAS